MQKQIKLRRPKLRATLPFIKKDAIRGTNVAYYKSYGRDMKDYLFREREKRRLGTQRWDYVSNILEGYTQKGFKGFSRAGATLKGIFKKNCAFAKGIRPLIKNTNLIKVISKPEMLWLAYKRLKGNRGILTRAATVSRETFNNFSGRQKEMYFRNKVTPDGFSFSDIQLACHLLRRGSYPWGSSRRIWLDKPGSSKKRPITIPPFMDRLIQEVIKMVLIAIWEPDFEKMNRSFGFRPNKSCHDAIVALQSNHTVGLRTALEGDISAAYDNVRKEDVIRCLEKKIHDRKFINLIRARLDYDYVDVKNKIRVKPSMGIPQGGVDSPYLFNIVFYELDQFVMGEVQSYLNKLNSKAGLTASGRRPIFKPRRNMRDLALRKLGKAKDLREQGLEKNKDMIFSLEREAKPMLRKVVRQPYYDPKVKSYRLFYVRYADDWIVLTNADVPVVQKMKKMIKEFLFTSLGAQLSDEKTVITDTRKLPAHFLGFEIVSHKKPKFMKVPGKGLKRVSTFPLIFRPDRTRLINRFHAKGFCNKKGFPISVPWLTPLEATVIIERFNASIRGLMGYYIDFISRDSDMQRWVYILRYSCFKTFAHKYKSSISKVMKRFGADRHSTSTKTIEVFARIQVGSISYEKSYKLVTFRKAKEECLIRKRWSILNRIFLTREAGTIGNYPLKRERPTITHENFLEMVNWVSLRSRAAFDMPCALCGSPDDVEMHHIKHIRKVAYRDLEPATYIRMMALRNRKQIPVCQSCHRLIHGAKYQGPPLRKMVSLSDKLVDNRVIHLESYVHPGEEHHSKPLIQRGWVPKLK